MKRKDIKVMIVDDDKDFADTTSDIIETLGFETLSVYNTTDAIENIDDEKIKIVISDIRIDNRMSGTKLIKRLQEKRNDKIYFIIVTGHSSASTAIEAIKNGAYDYLIKPVEPIKLINKMNDIYTDIELVLKEKEYKDILEKKIIEKTKILQAVVDNVPVGIWQCDRNGKTVFINKKFKDILEIKDEWQVGECISLIKDFMDDNNCTLFEDNFDKISKGKRGIFECEIITINNNVKSLKIIYEPVLENNLFIGSIGIVFDTTSNKKILRELETIKRVKNNV